MDRKERLIFSCPPGRGPFRESAGARAGINRGVRAHDRGGEVAEMPGAVRCTVEECVHNQSLHCAAESILVKKSGNDVAGTPRGTLCDTFSYRDPDRRPGRS